MLNGIEIINQLRKENDMCAKLSQLHAELSEQAAELGFETIQDAVNSGYVVDYERGKLVKHGLSYSETVEYLMKEQEKAHETWLEEKRKILNELNSILNAINGQAYNNFSDYELLTFIKNNKQIIAKAIEFIEGVKSE